MPYSIETQDTGVVAERHGTQVTIQVYCPLSNVGRRGKRVDRWTYQLHMSTTDRVNWDVEVKRALKKAMTCDQVLTTVRSILLRAEKDSMERGDEYPSKLYGPHKSQLKGVDPSIPDPESVLPLEDRKGRDISVQFSKPAITITSKSDARDAQRSFETTYIEVKWAHHKRVARIADDLVKLRGLKAVEQALKKSNIPYTLQRRTDPMFAAVRRAVRAQVVKAKGPDPRVVKRFTDDLVKKLYKAGDIKALQKAVENPALMRMMVDEVLRGLSAMGLGDAEAGVVAGKLDLSKIKVLYRQSDTMSLWGIPYQMRPGQSPRDLARRYQSQWTWLGSPGWWGEMSKDDQAAVKRFLHKYKDNVPTGPNEWDEVGASVKASSHETFRVWKVKRDTWSFENPNGMEVGRVTGKRRAKSFKEALEKSGLTDWRKQAEFYMDWKKKNPRPSRASTGGETRKEMIATLLKAGRPRLANAVARDYVGGAKPKDQAISRTLLLAQRDHPLVGESIWGKEGRAHFFRTGVRFEQYPPGGRTRGIKTAKIYLGYDDLNRRKPEFVKGLEKFAKDLKKSSWKQLVGQLIRLYNDYRDEYGVAMEVSKQKATDAPDPRLLKKIPTKEFTNKGNAHVMPRPADKEFSIKDLNDRANEPSAFTQGPMAFKKAVKLFHQWKDMSFRDIIRFWDENKIKYHQYMAMD